MRTPVQTVPFNFRVNETLLAEVREKARRDGISPSEFMRYALRRELQAAA